MKLELSENFIEELKLELLIVCIVIFSFLIGVHMSNHINFQIVNLCNSTEETPKNCEIRYEQLSQFHFVKKMRCLNKEEIYEWKNN